MVMRDRRPEWLKCIQASKTETACGRTREPFEWCFVDLEHAQGAVKQGSRLVPCEGCLSALEGV